MSTPDSAADSVEPGAAAEQDLLLPGLAGARIVPTPHFDVVRRRLELALGARSMLVVSGAHGSGKRVVLRAVAAERPEPTHRVVLRPQMTGKDLIRALYTAIHGDRDIYDLATMQNDLAHTLAAAPGILIIDEAQLLTGHLAGQLHYLHAHTAGCQWAIALLGGPGMARLASTDASLRGDVLQAATITPLTEAPLWRLVRGMHPLLSNADGRLLEQIDLRYTKGYPKRWAQFLRISLHLVRLAEANGKPTPTFDHQFVSLVINNLPRLQLGTADKQT